MHANTHTRTHAYVCMYSLELAKICDSNFQFYTHFAFNIYLNLTAILLLTVRAEKPLMIHSGAFVECNFELSSSADIGVICCATVVRYALKMKSNFEMANLFYSTIHQKSSFTSYLFTRTQTNIQINFI